MEDKIYKCPECGKKSKLDELIIRGENYISCPGCGYNWFEEIENPNPKKPSKKKK